MNSEQISVRATEAGDLDAVVALDGAYSGQSRRGFFTKRHAAMARHPEHFIELVAEVDGRFAGFAAARVLDGEFGTTAPVATLDALGVKQEHAHHGVGAGLMRTLKDIARERGATELRTRVHWQHSDLLGFLAGEGFELAPRVVLERDTESPRF